MQKNDLKALVTQMYEELIDNIETQKEATKEQVVTFLQDAVYTIANIKNEDVGSAENAKLTFTNAYKDIADKSILYYKDTNNIFEELNKIHKETLEEFNSTFIDLPKITEKFEDVQTHMSEEISRANSIITDLVSKIKVLETNSNIDSLTNVFNRRALTTYLNNICLKGNLNHQLHFLILDIDDFKKVNDTYGHIAGDKILIFIANILKKTLRDGDKVFRYGGEEFVIILNRIDDDVCTQVATRILKIISSNQLIYKGESLNVTMSIGATIYYDEDTPESLINRADKALYKSKTNGKNQMNKELL